MIHFLLVKLLLLNISVEAVLGFADFPNPIQCFLVSNTGSHG